MTYNLDFSRKLINVARPSCDKLPSFEDVQLVLNLSLLSCEISLKVLLEKSGYSEKKIRKFSHDLLKLLNEVTKCTFIHTLSEKQVCGSNLRTLEIKQNGCNTVGDLLERMDKEASKYPGEIRYGESFCHFPPGAMLECAKVIYEWADSHDKPNP